MTYIEKNAQIWDRRSENQDKWSIPVSSEEVQRAREGKWSIVLTPVKPVPADWFPAPLAGKKILCMAAAEVSKDRSWRRPARRSPCLTTAAYS